MACVLVEADQEKQSVRIVGFDLNSLVIETIFPAEVQQSGAAAIPADFAKGIFAKLPAEAAFDLSAGEGEGQIRCQNIRYKVPTMPVSEFPKLFLVEEAPIRLSKASVSECLSKVLFAVSKKEEKGVLTGVNIEVSRQHLKMAGTDGHRASVVSIDSFAEDMVPRTSLNTVIPLRALREVERIVSKHPADAIQFSVAPSFAQFELSCGELTLDKVDAYSQKILTRVLEGNFPSLGSVLPASYAKNAVLHRQSLMESIERILIVGKAACDFYFTQGNLLITAKTEAGSGEENISCESNVNEGELFRIRLSPGYVLDVLKVLKSEHLQVSFPDEVRQAQPVRFTPLSEIQFGHWIMPMAVKTDNE